MHPKNIEKGSEADAGSEGEDVLPVVLVLGLVGGREDPDDVSGVVELHEGGLVVDEDGEAGLVDERPFLVDEAVVDQVEVVQRHDAGQQREDPRQADDVEINVDLLEELVEIMDFMVQVVPDPGDV